MALCDSRGYLTPDLVCAEVIHHRNHCLRFPACGGKSPPKTTVVRSSSRAALRLFVSKLGGVLGAAVCLVRYFSSIVKRSKCVNRSELTLKYGADPP
jgi:hypothetical protein